MTTTVDPAPGAAVAPARGGAPDAPPTARGPCGDRVRPLRAEEQRAANALFRAAVHLAPATDDQWLLLAPGYQPQRCYGAFDPELVGVTQSVEASLTVPGLARIPVAMVWNVGVRPDRTRRGILTELMCTQLTDLAGHGVPAACLRSTEGGIYGRFGYGVATVCRSYTVDRRRAQLRPEVPGGGKIQLLDLDAARSEVPAIYAGLAGSRPGMLSRPPVWWLATEAAVTLGGSSPAAVGPLVVAAHHGPNGPDGYAVYRVEAAGSSAPRTLQIGDLHAGTAQAFAGLWRFMLGVDLVDEIAVACRPADEPIELLFADPRACRVTTVTDECWLRLVDVPAALAARTYSSDGPLVLEVSDPHLPGNNGRHTVSPEAVEPTDAPAELRLDVEALAMAYLGTWRPTALAAAGRIWASSRAALAAADRLFATPVASWTGATI